MLRKIQMSSGDIAISNFKYIDSVTKGKDSLSLYNYIYYTSNLMLYGKNEQALEINDKSLRLSKTKNWPYFNFENYQLRANIFDNLSILDSTLFYINKAESIIINNKEDLGHNMVRVYQQRSFLEKKQGNSEKEDFYMEKVFDVIEEYPEKNLSYYLSSIVYHFKSKKNYLKHSYYSQKLQEYYIKKNDFGLPESHQTISSMLKMNNTEEQIIELKKILKTSDSLNLDQYLIQTSNTLGEKLIELKNYDEAIFYLKKSTDNNFGDKLLYSKLISYSNLFKAYEKKKDYENAIKALQNYIEIQNEIRSKETLDKIAFLEIQHETEKKENELKLLKSEAEKKKKQNQIYLVLALSGLCMALLLGVFGFKNHKKNIELSKQKSLLEVALGEKNTLLKEIHHRVKNSFQIVSSLLYLQSESVHDTEAKLAIKEAENRVRSMILIHQKLYSRDELVGVNVKEYIKDLSTDIIESHLSNPNSLTTDLNVEPLVLDIETITPLGLILNELITNVIKHAYRDVDNKLLQVDLKRKENQLVLRVIDNGKGLTESPSESSFGITLMKALSKKLKASLDIKKREQQGTVATLFIKRFQILA